MIELSNAVLKAGIAHQQEYRAGMIQRACREENAAQIKSQAEAFGKLVENGKELDPMLSSVVIPNMTAQEFKDIIAHARYLYLKANGYNLTDTGSVSPFDVLADPNG